MLNKYLLALLVALGLLLGGAGWLLKRSYAEQGRLKGQLVAAQEAIAAAQKADALNRTLIRKQAQASRSAALVSASERARLEAALRAKTEWADTILPQEIADVYQ